MCQTFYIQVGDFLSPLFQVFNSGIVNGFSLIAWTLSDNTKTKNKEQHFVKFLT